MKRRDDGFSEEDDNFGIQLLFTPLQILYHSTPSHACLTGCFYCHCSSNLPFRSFSYAVPLHCVCLISGSNVFFHKFGIWSCPLQGLEASLVMPFPLSSYFSNSLCTPHSNVLSECLFSSSPDNGLLKDRECIPWAQAIVAMIEHP